MSESLDSLGWIDGELESLAARDLARKLRVRGGPQSARIDLDGRELISFAANDYLGLAGDRRLTGAVAAALAGGWGAGSSPLVSGRGRLTAELELRLAQFEGTEAALVFSSGFAANAGSIAALAGRGDAVYSDELNHASIVDGCRLSRAEVHVYPHADCERLQEILSQGQAYRRRLIVSDGLFSMGGDLAPLGELARLARRYGAMLLVDEAHATGVFGRLGRGVSEHFGIEHDVAVRVGTLSKALGGIGGFVCGSRRLIEWLVNKARPYVFSTAPPDAAAAAAMAALQIVQNEPERRLALLAQAAKCRGRLEAQGWRVGASASQIIPLLVGEPARAVALSESLIRRGLAVPAIRPPTVPAGQSLLRISLSWVHTPAMIERLVDALAAEAGKGGRGEGEKGGREDASATGLPSGG